MKIKVGTILFLDPSDPETEYEVISVKENRVRLEHQHSDSIRNDELDRLIRLLEKGFISTEIKSEDCDEGN